MKNTIKKVKEKNVKEHLEFLLLHANLVSIYDIEKISENVTADLVNDAIDANSKEGKFFGGELFDFGQSVEYNVGQFNVWLHKNFNSDKELFSFYAKNISLFYNYYLSESDDKKNFKISQIHYSAANLFYFLRHIILGTADADFGPANDLSQEFIAKHYKATLNFGGQSLTIKSYDNGRLDIKGLTPEQDAQIRSLIKNKKQHYLKPLRNGEWGY